MAIFEKKQELFKNNPKAPKEQKEKPLSESDKPKSLFEEKKEWRRGTLKEKIKNAPSHIPGTGGRSFYSNQEQEEMIERGFPSKRFGDYISESDAKKRLREMKKEEGKAKTSEEKIKINRARRYLEDQFGLKGKY